MKTYVVALLVVVGVLAGFYGGFKVGQNNVSANTSSSQKAATRTPGNFGGFTGGGGGGGARLTAVCPSPGAPSPSPGSQAVARGTISNLSSTSMTVTSTACDVKVVFGNTVQVSKNVAGNTSDLRDNITVTIVGTRQADGSIKATQIQIGNAGIGQGAASPAGG